MTDLKKAAQQALKALEQCGLDDTHRSYEFEHAARAALRAALAQPLPDPVDEYRKGFIDGQIDMRDRLEAQQEPEQKFKPTMLFKPGEHGAYLYVENLPTALRQEIYTKGWRDAVACLSELLNKLHDPVSVHHSHHWLLDYISQHVAAPAYLETRILDAFERTKYAKQEQKAT
jgi:hypothetical protein